MQTSFEVDTQTLCAIQGLQGSIGVNTNAQVIRKALALARVMAAHARFENGDWMVDIVSPSGQRSAVLLSS